jgi:hypothetical protein
MRLLIPLLAVLGMAMMGGALTPATATDDAYVLALDQQQPGGQPPTAQFDVDVSERGRQWWTNPVWIGVGIVALILLIVIVALATRGGGRVTGLS